MSVSKRWCFTLNNYDEAELDSLCENLQKKEIRYAIVGRETGEGGTPHLQGYFSSRKAMRFKAVKNMVGDRAHVEMAKGSEQSNFEYCSKEGFYTEYGTRASPGKRSDLEAFKDAVKAGERNPVNLREHHSEVAAQYPRFFEAYIRDHAPKPDLEYHPLYDWQQDLNERLKKTPDRREIIFVVDSEGNRGKTWFAQYYCELHDNAIILEPGKKADMAYALPDECRVLFVNVTREQNEFLNYSFLESCKDGMVFSTKYESRVKRYNAMHVVVLMNQFPDLSKLSRDRYNIIQLD